MGKSISHYRREFESISGDFCTVRAWRSPTRGGVHYAVQCRICKYRSPKLSDDFHSAMGWWAFHAALHNLGGIDYPVEATAEEIDAAAVSLKCAFAEEVWLHRMLNIGSSPAHREKREAAQGLELDRISNEVRDRWPI